MLTIRSICPAGMFSYGKVSEIDVTKRGLVNLIGVNEDKGGDSNGSGKTSLFNALCEVLFGENPTGVSGNEVANQILNEGFAGRVEFSSWENAVYRVTYCRNWKEDFYPVDNDKKASYKGTALFLDRLEGDRWVDCRGSSMGETRATIDAAIGITYSRFLSISYLSHRVGSAFLRGTNKERMDVLAGITGVEDWDRILASARLKKQTLSQDISVVQNKISYEEGALSQLRNVLSQLKATDWNEVLLKCDVDLGTAQGQHDAAETQCNQLREAWLVKKEAQTEAYNRSGSGAVSQEISDLTIQLNDLRNPLFVDKALPEFDLSIAQKAENLRSERDLAAGGLRALMSGTDIRNLENCPTCGLKITKKSKEDISSKIRLAEDRVHELEEALKEQMAIKIAEEDRIRQARALVYQDRLQKAISVEAQIAEKRELLKQSNLEYEKVTGEMHALEIQGRQAQALCAQYKQRIAQLTSYRSDVSKRVGEISSTEIAILEKERLVSEYTTSIADTAEDVKVLEWIISNIPYIKLHRMSVAMEQLSEKVNGYLSEMGDTIRVNVTSFEEKKSKKGAGDIKDALKSEVKVEIVDGEKNIDPRLYSDGETSKISNAVIRALHDLATQSGHGCNLVLLDEIFSFVDSNNSQRLADSFSSVNSGTTFITDNSGHVENLMDFDEVWIARKSNGLTTIEVR